jgi:transglutaminase-like putative cysteine protease
LRTGEGWTKNGVPQPYFGAADSSDSSSESARVVHMEMRYKVDAPGDTQRARVVLLVPTDLPLRQRILSREWILPPTATYERAGGLEAEWIFDEPKGSFELGCILSVELTPFDLAHPSEDVETNPVDLATYLRDEAFLEKRSPRVARAAKELAPKKAAGLKLLRELFDGTLFELENHGFIKAERGANRALKMGGGDCTDFSDVLVALCRGRGLPARHVRGILARSFSSKDTPKHSWVEVHLPERGWVRVDPFFTKLGHTSFEELPNEYVSVSFDRNEEVENFWRYWYWGDPIKVTESLDLGHGIWRESVGTLKD